METRKQTRQVTHIEPFRLSVRIAVQSLALGMADAMYDAGRVINWVDRLASKVWALFTGAGMLFVVCMFIYSQFI